MAKLCSLQKQYLIDQKVKLMLEIEMEMGTEVEAVIQFDAGQFRRAVVVPAPRTQGEWMLELQKKDQGAVIISKQRGSLRRFKTIDAACRLAMKIGFRTITVSL
jgi:hypothetical protein